MAESKAYLQQLEASNKVANKHTSEIKKQLKAHFDSYEKSLRSLSQESSSSLKKQADNLEKVQIHE